MLPAPPASCAGWWFYQLLKAVERERPARIRAWQLRYSSDGSFLAKPAEPDPRMEVFLGDLQEGSSARRCGVSWEWPGDDGNLHTSAATWQPGETLVRPLAWWRRRRPIPLVEPDSAPAPWPLNVSLDIRGGHGQLLEQAEFRAWQDPPPDETSLHREAHRLVYRISWKPPWGAFRLPETELPCNLSSASTTDGRYEQALTLAGLTLAWRIDIDREAWLLWRRFPGTAVLNDLGGVVAACPNHGADCPWPASGRTD